jgi:hypothetical protein
VCPNRLLLRVFGSLLSTLLPFLLLLLRANFTEVCNIYTGITIFFIFLFTLFNCFETLVTVAMVIIVD